MPRFDDIVCLTSPNLMQAAKAAMRVNKGQKSPSDASPTPSESQLDTIVEDILASSSFSEFLSKVQDETVA